MITPAQLKMARAALSLSQAKVAEAAGISTTAYNAIECGQSDPRVSTLRNVKAAFEAKGAIFGADGSVKIGPPRPRAEFLVASPDMPVDPAARAAAIRILNVQRRMRGEPLIDEEDE
jgi:transcriptional regulator with XRE-family HTH domain